MSEPDVRRQCSLFGLVLLYVMLLVAVDVGFIIVARHQDTDNIVVPIINKTHEHLNTVIRTAFVTQQEQHVLQTADKLRTLIEKTDQQQINSQEEKVTERD